MAGNIRVVVGARSAHEAACFSGFEAADDLRQLHTADPDALVFIVERLPLGSSK